MDAVRGLEEMFHYLQETPPVDADTLIFFLQHRAAARVFSDHASRFCQGKGLLYKAR